MSRKYKFRNPDGIYFVSFAVVYWLDLFVREQYSNILTDALMFYSKERLELFAYCIMPSHVHLIFRDKKQKPEMLLGNIKRYTSQQIRKAITENPLESRRAWLLWMMEHAAARESNVNKSMLWQHHNKPFELWSINVIMQKLEYIHHNPVEAGFIVDPAAWKYSSAINYTGGKGVIDVIIIE